MYGVYPPSNNYEQKLVQKPELKLEELISDEHIVYKIRSNNQDIVNLYSSLVLIGNKCEN